jgi:protein gp37
VPDTSIEWTDVTWNPVRGCSRISEGCRNCYAEVLAARFSDEGYWGHGFADRTKAGGRWTGKVSLIPEKLAEPLSWKKPRRCFVNSMSDLFHEALSFEEIAAVFGVMAACPHVTFQVLTKRPERTAEFFRWLAKGEDAARAACVFAAGDAIPEDPPRRFAEEMIGDPSGPWPLPNVWLGTSVENQETANRRIPFLLDTPASVRFVSYEPALGPVDFGFGVSEGVPTDLEPFRERADLLHWIIVGGESGPGARPFDLAWARSTVEQCKAAGVASFVKQVGAHPFCDDWHSLPARLREGVPLLAHNPACPRCRRLKDKKGGDWSEWPEDLRVREFPEVTHAPR